MSGSYGANILKQLHFPERGRVEEGNRQYKMASISESYQSKGTTNNKISEMKGVTEGRLFIGRSHFGMLAVCCDLIG